MADAWRDYVGLAAFAMAFNMTVPMVLWVRYRGHSWERGGEMAMVLAIYRKEEYSATHQTGWHPYRRWFAGAH